MIRKGALFGAKKKLLTLRGAMFREAPLNQSATVRPLNSELQRPGCNWLSEGIGCGLGLKYALRLIVAVVVSKVN